MIVETFVVGVLRTNCYLVYQPECTDAVLIDPGRSHARIEARLAELGREVTAVLLTHGHFDHMLEAGYWQSKGAKVYVHALDADKLYSDKNLGYMVGARVPHFNADVTLQDGDKVEQAGISFEVLHTPGHSVGSVVYRVDDTLFTGDTLFCDDHGRTDFPDGSHQDMVASLHRLFALEGDYRVLPGHDCETTLQRERQENKILRDPLWK